MLVVPASLDSLFSFNHWLYRGVPTRELPRAILHGPQTTSISVSNIVFLCSRLCQALGRWSASSLSPDSRTCSAVRPQSRQNGCCRLAALLSRRHAASSWPLARVRLPLRLYCSRSRPARCSRVCCSHRLFGDSSPQSRHGFSASLIVGSRPCRARTVVRPAR